MIRAGLVVILALALALGYALWGKSRADNRADRAQEANERTTQQLADTQTTLETERAYSLAISKIAGQHERDKYEIEQRATSDLAELRAGNLRLHDRWAACAATSQLSAASAAAGKPDDGAASREDSAVRIVRAAEQCDAQVRGLQAVVMADRQ